MFNNQAKWNSEQHYRDPNRRKGYSSAEAGNTCSVSAYHLLGPSCTSEYSSNGSDVITQNLERYIKSTKTYKAETEWFLKEIRCKIFCLHEYNLKVAEADYQKKYPLTPYLRKLLIQYVILECRYFQRSSRFVFPPNEIYIQKRVLRLLFIVFGDYFRYLHVEPLKLSTECSKEVVRLFVELKSQFDIQSSILDKIVERLLKRIGKLEPLKFLQGKSLPCPVDSLLATPDFINIHRRVIKDLWTDRLDLHQQLEYSSNDDEEEEVTDRSSLVPTIQLEDDNSHKIFWDTEVDTRVRWWRSPGFTSNGMPFIETVQLDSSDEESTSGHSHCDIVNTIDVNISNKDLISSRQASPYVVAFNVSDGDIGKGVILSNSKKTSSQFIVSDVKERKKTVFPKKPFLDISRTLSEHSGPSGKDDSREKDKDLKLQPTKPCLIQSTSNLHCTINISNEIFTGFDTFLNSHDSEYSYRKSTKDYKETPNLHSKHQNFPCQKGVSTAQEKRKEKFRKRDSIQLKPQSITFFDNLISRLDRPDRSSIKIKNTDRRSSDFRTLEHFGGKLAVKTKISTEVSGNKSTPPSGIGKNILIEISSDEEDVVPTSAEHIKLETSVDNSEATEAEKVALKNCDNVEAKEVIEIKHVSDTIATEHELPKSRIIEEDLCAASSQLSPGNSEVVKVNKSAPTLCDEDTVNESENIKNIAETVEPSLPKDDIENDIIETSNVQLSDTNAENHQNKSHIIAEMTLAENNKLLETLTSAGKVQNIISREHNDKESIEPNLSTDVSLCSKVQNVEGTPNLENVIDDLKVSSLETGDVADVSNKDEDYISEECASNEKIGLIDVHGEEETRDSANKKLTPAEELEKVIEASSMLISDELDFNNGSTKFSESSSKSDTKKVKESKKQTEDTPTESSMLSILTNIEMKELEKILSEEKNTNIEVSDQSNHSTRAHRETTEHEVRTEESNQFINVKDGESTGNDEVEDGKYYNESSLSAEHDRLSGLEKSYQVFEAGKSTTDKETNEAKISKEIQISEIEKTLRISGEDGEKSSVEKPTTSNELTNNEVKMVKPCRGEMENTPERNQPPAEDLKIIESEKCGKRKNYEDTSSLENQERIDIKSTKLNSSIDDKRCIEGEKSTESIVNEETSVELNLSATNVPTDEKIVAQNFSEEQNISSQVIEKRGSLVNENAVEVHPEFTLTEQTKVTESTIISDSVDLENGELIDTNFDVLRSDGIDSENAENKLECEENNEEVVDKAENIFPINEVVPTSKNEKDCCSRKKYVTQKPADLGPEDEDDEILKSCCADSLATMAKNVLEKCSNSREDSYGNISDHGEHSNNTDSAVKDKETGLNENEDITEASINNERNTIEKKLNYTDDSYKVDVYDERALDAEENDNIKQLQEVAAQEDGDVVKTSEEFLIEYDHTIQVAKVADILEERIEAGNDAPITVRETDIETLEQHEDNIPISENTELQPEIHPSEADMHQTLPPVEDSIDNELLMNTHIEDITSADQDLLVKQNNVNVSKPDESLLFSNESLTPENEILPVDQGNVTPLQEIEVNDFVASYETINTESHSDVQDNFVPEIVTNVDLEKLKTDTISEHSSTGNVDNGTYFESPSNLDDSVTVKDVVLQDKTESVHNEQDHVNLDDNIPVASEVEIEYSEAYEGVAINTEDCATQNSLIETPKVMYENSNSNKPLNVPLRPRGRKQRAPRGRRASVSSRMTSITSGLGKEAINEHTKDLIESTVEPSLTTDKVPRSNTFLHMLATIALEDSHCDIIVPNEEPKVSKHERKPRQRRKYNEEGVKRLTRSSSRKSSLSCDIDVKPHDFLYGATTLPKSVNVFNQYVPEPVAVSERSDESNDRLLIDDDGMLMEKEQNVPTPTYNDDQVEDSLQLEFEEKSTRKVDNFQTTAALDYNFKPFRTKAEKKAYSTNSLYVSLEKLHTKEMFENGKHHRSRSFDINMLPSMHDKKEMSKLVVPLIIEPLDIEPLEVIEPPHISAKGIFSATKKSVSKSPAQRKSKTKDTLAETSSSLKKLRTEVTITPKKSKFSKEVTTYEMVTGDDTIFNQEVEISTELPGTLLKNKKKKAADGKVNRTISNPDENLVLSNELDSEKLSNSTKITLNKELPPVSLNNKKGKAKLPAKGKRNKVVSGSSVNLCLANELNFEKQLNDIEISPNKELQISVTNRKGKAKLPAKGKRNKEILDSAGDIPLTDLNSEKQLHNTSVKTISNKELIDKSSDEKLPVKITRTKSISNSTENLPLPLELNTEKQLDNTEVNPNKELLRTSQNIKGKTKLPAKGKKAKIATDSIENFSLTTKLNLEGEPNSTELTSIKPSSVKNKKKKTKSPVIGKRNRAISFSGESVLVSNELDFEKQLTSTDMTSNQELLPSSLDIKKKQTKLSAKGKLRKSISDSSEKVPLTNELNSENQLDNTEITQSNELPHVSLKNKVVKAKLPVKVKKSKPVSDSGETDAAANELNLEKQLDSKEMTRSKELPQVSLKCKAGKAKLPIKVTRNKFIPDSNENLLVTNEVNTEKQPCSTEIAQNVELLQSPLKNKRNKTKLPVTVKRNKSLPDFRENITVNNVINSEKQLNSVEFSQSKELPLKNKTDEAKLSDKVKRNKSIPDSGENLPVNNDISSEIQLDSTEFNRSKELPLKNKTDKAKLPLKVKRSKSISFGEILTSNNELNLEKQVDSTEVKSKKKTDKTKLPVNVNRSKLIPDFDDNLPVTKELNLVKQRDPTKFSVNKEPLQAPQGNKKGKAQVKGKRNKGISDSVENLSPINDLNFDKPLENTESYLNKEPLQDSLKSKKEKPKSSFKGKKIETETDCLEDLPLAILKKQFEKNDRDDDYDELPLIVRMNLIPNQPEKKEKQSLNNIKKTPKMQQTRNDIKLENKDSTKIRSPNKKSKKRDHLGEAKEENIPQCINVEQKMEDPSANTDCKRLKLNNMETEKVQESGNEKVFTLPLKFRRKSVCKDSLSKFSGLPSPTEIIAKNIEDIKPATGLDKKYMLLPKLKVKTLTDNEKKCFEQNEPSQDPVTTSMSLDNLFKCKNTIITTTEKLKMKLKSDLLTQDPLIDSSPIQQDAKLEDVPNKRLSSITLEKSINENETPLQTSDKTEIPTVTVEKSIDMEETPLQVSDKREILPVIVEKSIEGEETPLQTSDKTDLPSVTVEKSIEEKETPLQTSDKKQLPSGTVENSIERKETPLQTSDQTEIPSFAVEKSIDTSKSIQSNSVESISTEILSVSVEKVIKGKEIPLQISHNTELPSVTGEKSVERKESPLESSDKMELSSVTIENPIEEKNTPLQISEKIKLCENATKDARIASEDVTEIKETQDVPLIHNEIKKPDSEQPENMNLPSVQTEIEKDISEDVYNTPQEIEVTKEPIDYSLPSNCANKTLQKCEDIALETDDALISKKQNKVKLSTKSTSNANEDLHKLSDIAIPLLDKAIEQEKPTQNEANFQIMENCEEVSNKNFPEEERQISEVIASEKQMDEVSTYSISVTEPLQTDIVAKLVDPAPSPPILVENEVLHEKLELVSFEKEEIPENSTPQGQNTVTASVNLIEKSQRNIDINSLLSTSIESKTPIQRSRQVDQRKRKRKIQNSKTQKMHHISFKNKRLTNTCKKQTKLSTVVKNIDVPSSKKVLKKVTSKIALSKIKGRTVDNKKNKSSKNSQQSKVEITDVVKETPHTNKNSSQKRSNESTSNLLVETADVAFNKISDKELYDPQQDLPLVSVTKAEAIEVNCTVNVPLKLNVTCSQSLSSQLSPQKKEKKSIESIITQLKENNVSSKSEVVVENLKKKLKEKIHYSPKDAPLTLLKKGDEKFSPILYRNKKIKRKTEISTPVIPDSKQEMEIINDNSSNRVPSRERNEAVVDEPTSKLETVQSLEITQPKNCDSTEQILVSKDKIIDVVSPSQTTVDVQTKSESDPDSSFLSNNSSHLEQDSSLEAEKVTSDLLPLPEVSTEKDISCSIPVDQSEHTHQDDALVINDASMPISEPKIDSNEAELTPDVSSNYELSESGTDKISTNQDLSIVLDISSSSNKESTNAEEPKEPTGDVGPKIFENSSKYIEIKTINESSTETIPTVCDESMPIQSSLPIYQESIPLNESTGCSASLCEDQSTNHLISLAHDETTVTPTNYQVATPTNEFASCMEQGESTLIDNSLPHYQESATSQDESTHYLISTAQDPNYLISTNQNESVVVKSSLSNHQELPNADRPVNSSVPTIQDVSILIDDSFNCHIRSSENNLTLNQPESIPSSSLTSQHDSTMEMVAKAPTDSLGHIFAVESMINGAPITDVSFDDFVTSTEHKEPENQLTTEDFNVTCKEEPLTELLLTYEESISDVKSDFLSLVSESEPGSDYMNHPVTSNLSVEHASSHSSLHGESTTDFREVSQTHVESESSSETKGVMESNNLNLPVIEISNTSTLTTKNSEVSFVSPPLQSIFTKDTTVAKMKPNFSEQGNEADNSCDKSVKKGLSLPLLETATAKQVVDKSKFKDRKKKSSIKATEPVKLSTPDLFNSTSTKPNFPVQNWEPSVESFTSPIERFDAQTYEQISSCVKALNCQNVIKEIVNSTNLKRNSLSMPTLETVDTVSIPTVKTDVQFKRNLKLEIHSPPSTVSPRKRVVRFNLPENSPTNLPNDCLKRKKTLKSLPTIETTDDRLIPDLVETSNLRVENKTEANNSADSKINPSTTISPKKGLDLPILETSDFTENIYNKSPKKAGRNLDMPILETSPPVPVVSKKYRRSSTDVPIVQDSVGPRGIATRTRKKSLDLPIIQPLNATPEKTKISLDKPCSRKTAALTRDILSRALVGISLNADKMSISTEPSTSQAAITKVTSADDFLLNVTPKDTSVLTSSEPHSTLNLQRITSVEQSKMVSEPIVSSASIPMEENLSDTVPVSKPMEYEEFKKWITGVVPEPLIKLQDENFENCLVSDMSTEAKGIPEVHSEVEVYCEKPEAGDKSKYFNPIGAVPSEFLNSPSHRAPGDDDQIPPFALPNDNIDAPEYTGEVIIEPHDMRNELIGEIIKSPSFIDDSEEGPCGASEVSDGVLSCLDPDPSKPGPSGCQAGGKRQTASTPDLLNFQDISPTKFSQALELMSPKISYSTSNFGGESSNVMLSTKMIDDSQTFSGCTPRTEIRCCLDDTTDHTYHHLGGPLLSMFSHNFNNDPLEPSTDNFNSHLPDLSKAPGGDIGESQNTSEPYLVNFSLSDFENINLIDLSTSENKSDRKKIDITNVPLMEEMELPDKTWQQFTAHNPKVIVVMNERCSTPTYSMSEDIFGSESNSRQSQSTDSQSPIRMEKSKAETKSDAKGKSIPRPKDGLKLDAKEGKESSVKEADQKGETTMKTAPCVSPRPNCQIKVKQNLFPENKPSSSVEENGSDVLEAHQNKPPSHSVINTPDKPSQEASSATNSLKSKKKNPVAESEEVPLKRFRMSKKGAGNAAAVSNIFDAVKFRQRKSTNRYTSEEAALSKRPFDKMGSFLDSSARISDTSKFLDEFNQKVSSEKEALKKTTTKSTPTRPVSPQREPQNKEPNLKTLNKKVSPKYSKDSQQDSLTDNLLNYGLKLRFCLKGSHNVRVEPVETSSQEVRETVEQPKSIENPRSTTSTAKEKPETSKKSSNVNTSHVEDYKTKDSTSSDYFRKVKTVSREADISPCLTDNLLNHNLLRRELSRPTYKSRPPEPPGPFLNYTSRPSTSGTSKSVYDSRSKEKYPPWYENHYKPKYPPEPNREASDSSKSWNYSQDPNRRTYGKNAPTNDFVYRDYNRPPPDSSKRSTNGVHNHSIDHILNRDSMKYKQYKSEDASKRSSSSSEEDRMRKMRKGESEFDSLYKTGNQNPNFMLKVTKSNRLKLVKQRNRFYDESKNKPDYYKEHDFGRVSPRDLRESSGSLHRSYPGGSFMDREKKFRGKADYSGSLLEMPRSSMSSDRMRGNSSISDFREMRTSRESLESMDKKNERRYKDSSVMGEVPHGSLSPDRSKGSSASMDRAMKEARDKSQDDDKKNKPGRQKEWFEIFDEKFDYGSSAPKFW